MKLTDFDYNLPSEFIAQFPLESRETSKMMVLERATGKISHRKFIDIVDYLKAGDTLILNDTKVVPARLLGKKKDTGGKVEVFLLNRIKKNIFNALIRPTRIKNNQKIVFNNNGLEAEVLSRKTVRFNTDDCVSIYSHGNIPLPPYIKRPPEKLDKSRYQTVYAKTDGAVAAPTAGLHFTKALLSKIKKNKINIGYLTLHVGWGTFRSVRNDDIASHKMDAEYFQISKNTLDLVEKTKKQGGRVFAVGTTATRALETIIDKNKQRGQTDLFIYPGYKFKSVDCLLTNFHLPRSTLLMLVAAFASLDFIKRAYADAIKNNYRFYSYGDCMLII